MTQNEFLSRSQVDFDHFWKFCTLGDPSREIEKIRLGSKLKILFQPLQVVSNDPKRVSITVPGRFWPFWKFCTLGDPSQEIEKIRLGSKLKILFQALQVVPNDPKRVSITVPGRFGHFWKFCTLGDPSREIEKIRLGSKLKILFQPPQVVLNDPKRVSITVSGRFWQFLKILHLGGPLPGDGKNSVRVKIENLILTIQTCSKWPKTSFYHGPRSILTIFENFAPWGTPPGR